MNDQLKKAISAAHTPEANAKRAATLAAKRAAKKAAKVGKVGKKVTSIPLESIPDDRPVTKLKKAKVKMATLDGLTRERAALEIMRLTMWLAQQK
jgi:hypothetical protein